MTPAAVMVHLCRGVATVHLTQLQQAQALIQVLHNRFCEIADVEVFPLRVLNDLESLVRRRELFIQEIVDLVVVDFEVAALDDDDAVLLLFHLVNLLEELLKAVDEDAFVLDALQYRRAAPLASSVVAVAVGVVGRFLWALALALAEL